jgi:hypothetical protein
MKIIAVVPFLAGIIFGAENDKAAQEQISRLLTSKKLTSRRYAQFETMFTTYFPGKSRK